MRHFSLITLASPAIARTSAPQISASSCKDYVLISSRGTAEGQGPSSVFAGAIETVLGTLANGIEVDTVYPADWNLDPHQSGANWIHQYITQSLASCPRQNFALLGYSQGAMVSSGALEKLSNGANGAIKAALFFGNPCHVPQRNGNVDEHGGNLTAGAFGLNWTHNPSAVNDFAVSGRLLDVCFTGDIVCNSAPSFDLSAHGRYGASQEVQKMGANFLLRHLHE
ncbi:hypothetical protein CF336_g3796 [Tilletia laevis]|nr:hypothetical protein CF336_g3796 [Tilletia laevis]